MPAWAAVGNQHTGLSSGPRRRGHVVMWLKQGLNFFGPVLKSWLSHSLGHLPGLSFLVCEGSPGHGWIRDWALLVRGRHPVPLLSCEPVLTSCWLGPSTRPVVCSASGLLSSAPALSPWKCSRPSGVQKRLGDLGRSSSHLHIPSKLQLRKHPHTYRRRIMLLFGNL